VKVEGESARGEIPWRKANANLGKEEEWMKHLLKLGMLLKICSFKLNKTGMLSFS
jgi:hypothetical protein